MSIWAPLAEGTVAKRYRAGQLIYLQGTEATEFYYVVQGRVKSYISSPEGGERMLTVHHSGDLMGEASFFDECPRVSSAVAVEDSEIVTITRPRLNQVFARHPELALPMLQYLARTVRLLSSHVDGLSFLPADRRLARALLDQVDRNGFVHCTHEELGDAVGVSRVTVSRILAQFVRKGWLETGYRSLALLNREELERFANTEL